MAYGEAGLLSMAKQKRNDVVVKIDAEVVRKAKTVAAYRGLDLNVFLSDHLAPQMDQLLCEQAEEIARKQHGPTNGNGEKPKRKAK